MSRRKRPSVVAAPPCPACSPPHPDLGCPVCGGTDIAWPPLTPWRGTWKPRAAKKLTSATPIKRVPKLAVVVRDESGAEVVVEGDPTEGRRGGGGDRCDL